MGKTAKPGIFFLVVIVAFFLLSSIFLDSMPLWGDDDEEEADRDTVEIDAGAYFYVNTEGENLHTMPQAQTPLPESAKKGPEGGARLAAG